MRDRESEFLGWAGPDCGQSRETATNKKDNWMQAAAAFSIQQGTNEERRDATDCGLWAVQEDAADNTRHSKIKMQPQPKPC